MVLSGREYVGAKRIQVNKTTYTIGRDADNDFCINDPCVGRHHCRIEYDPVENTCYAIDNGSVNSTYLNSERLTAGQRCRLIQGDRIRIADRELKWNTPISDPGRKARTEEETACILHG